MGTYNGKEPYMFVSYSHKDSALVMPIIQGLQSRGFRVWYDEGIEVSVAWAKYVGERLEQCSCMLAYVTGNFDDSDNCWQELNFAMEEKKQIVAIKDDGGRKLSAGMRMRLGAIQTMPYEKYGSVEKILESLDRAAVLKPCLGAAAQAESPAPALVKPPEPSAAELARQGRAFYDRKEYEKAIPLFQRAAELGDAFGQRNLGYCYEKGLGVTQNYEEAEKWYRKAAELGDVQAQHNLGNCYRNGWGVTQNYEEAEKWYRKAAEQGESTAQLNLGYCYGIGLGVTQNYEEAVKWYRKAAEQGNFKAQFNLGLYYKNGWGVRKNKAEARKWFQKAADQGDQDAVNQLKKL